MGTKKKPDNLGRDFGDKFLAADGFAQTYPEHKYLIVEGLREIGYRVGMTGDGVNDSPALKRADVGIAVFGATDAAKAAADIVLTTPGLSTIVEGILISRRIWCRVRSFLTYRIAATLQLLTFFFIAVFLFRPNEYMPKDWEHDPEFMDTHEWPPFFHMPVLMLITLLNDGTLITIGYDYAVAPKTPPKWNLPFLFSMAFVQAFVAMISSVNLLHILLHSWDENSLIRQLGLGGISYGKITSSIHLKVSVSDFLTLFSARAGGDWFFMVKPAPVLLYGAMFALTCSTCLAMFWPKSYPDGIQTEGLVVDLVVGRGCSQGVLQVDCAQVQHLRHQQYRCDGDDPQGYSAAERHAQGCKQPSCSLSFLFFQCSASGSKSFLTARFRTSPF